jgi:hypothetical protein
LCSSQRRKESYQERERNGLEAAMTGYLTPDSNLQEALLLKKMERDISSYGKQNRQSKSKDNKKYSPNFKF